MAKIPIWTEKIDRNEPATINKCLTNAQNVPIKLEKFSTYHVSITTRRVFAVSGKGLHFSR